MNIDKFEHDWRFDESNCFEILKFLAFIFKKDLIEVPQGLSSIQRCIELVYFEINRTYDAIINRKNIQNPSQDSYLGDFTSLICREFIFFENKKIVFLIDDFSSHRVPLPVQKVLIKIIWSRMPSYTFKISSEKYGTIFSKFTNASADIGREMKEIDCGAEYINLSDSSMQIKAIEFAKELLNNRLTAANYSGNADTIISDTHWPAKTLTKCLLEHKGKPKNICYHGIQCISQICSGDISTLLMIYEEIFNKGQVQKNTTDSVPPYIQHDAIKTVSKQLLERIKSYYPLGKEMYDVVLSFGSLLKRLLYAKIRTKGNVLYQCPRIEIDAKSGDVFTEISDHACNLARSLVQRSIFIELNPGSGRNNVATTLRWQIRRIYLPHFLVGLSKTVPIKKDPKWLESFLLNPSESCDTYANLKIKNNGTNTLFDLND